MWRLNLYRGMWCAAARIDGKTKRRSLHTKDRGEAERLLRDWSVKPKGDLIGEIMTAYIADREEVGKRSIHAMNCSWKALKPTFAHLRPDHITRLLCRSYAKARRKGGVKDGTIIKDLGVLRAGLRWAKKGSEAVFDMPQTPPPRDRYINREEMESLAQAAESAHTALFIRLAWATAGRASAILELTWDRVDFERGQIKLSTGEGRRKGRATVPMTDSLRVALIEAHKVRISDYVVEWGGEHIKNISKAFRRACERAKLEDVSPHVMRHSAAVALAEADTPMAVIAQYLGHTDTRITERVYAKFSPTYLKKAARALE